MDWNLDIANRDGVSPRSADRLDIAQIEAVVNAAPRPSVLLTEREISVLRRGLTKDGWKRSLYIHPAKANPGVYTGEGLRAIAQRSLQRKIVIPARGGHYHNFFCDCGSRLSIPDDLAVCDEYTCPTCGHKYYGEDYNGALRYLQHQSLAGSVLALAIVYAIEKDRNCADKAAEILLKYADAYPGPHTDTTTGGILYQSLCEAVWVIPLAQAYDLIYYSRSMDDEQRSLIEGKLFRPVAEGLRRVGIRGNWGSWHLSAVGVIGFAIRDAAMVAYALESFQTQMLEQLGDDGIWPESIHCYHFYALSAFVHFAEACCRCGLDIYDWEVAPGKSLKNMFLAPLQYMYPSFELPAIKDGWCDSVLPVHLYEIAHRRWSDGAFAWVLKKAYRMNSDEADGSAKPDERLSRRSFNAFLFGRDLPGRAMPPVMRSTNFSSIGISTLRNGTGSMATLVHGPFLPHGHLDKLSFTLFANGQVVIPDYGTPGYGSGITDWYRSTPAHNTVVVDGKSQQPASGYGLVAQHSGTFLQYAHATAEDVYPGVAQSRRLMLLDGVCIIMDDLTSADIHDYDWFVRCDGRVVPPVDLLEDRTDLSAYPELRRAHSYGASDGARVDWHCANGGVALGIWTQPGSSVVTLGVSPAETAAKQVSTLMCRQHGRSVRFTAVIAPSAKADADLVKTGRLVRIGSQGGADYVYLRDAAAEDGNAILATDGEMAAVRTVGDRIESIVLINGSWISWNGRQLIECPGTVACAEVCFNERNPTVRYCCDVCGVVRLRTTARAMRINGHRTAAASHGGQALLRVTPAMLAEDAELHGNG